VHIWNVSGWQGMSTLSEPEGTAGYAAFLSAAAEAPARLRASRPNLSDVDRADAEAYLAALIDGAVQFLAADPSRPAFVPWVTPTRRWMDNGFDSVYWMAPVDGRHRYRLSGRRGDECYLSLTLYAGDPGSPETVVLNRNHVDLQVANGAAFALELDPPDDACYVITRQYSTRPSSDVPGTFSIEVLDGPRPDPSDVAATEARWGAATSFLRAMTRPGPAAAPPPAYVSTTANVMGDPSAWDRSGGGRGTPDQTYALGPYDLGSDEALVMDVKFPACAYASAALWNRFSQTVDRRFHRSTINHTEAICESSGSSRVVVAHRDPGVPNWLDTGGRSRGSVFWRFLLAEHPPQPIVCRVVRAQDVRSMTPPP
jgi:hypothetical protein